MARRIELGAGIASGVLALLALALLLFTPLVPTCTRPGECPANTTPAYVPLPQTHLGADAWALIIAPALLTVIGAAGAISDARYGTHRALGAHAGTVSLGVAASLMFLLCALGSAGVVGVVYFPATLALALAAYGAFLARSSPRSSARAPAAPSAPDDTPGQ
jgi:hypothetical protein